jgi:hypothetical protein
VSASLAGWAEATDPQVVGRQLAQAIGAVVCRCVHGRRSGVPCEQCARVARRDTVRLGRLLIVFVTGRPYGTRPLSEAELGEVGKLLEQLDRLAAGQPLRHGTTW